MPVSVMFYMGPLFYDLKRQGPLIYDFASQRPTNYVIVC